MFGMIARFPLHVVAGLLAGPFGLRRIALLVPAVPALLVVWAAHAIALLLDELWFPGYREVRIREPLFVVGMPRSGTSAMQEILADDPRFTTTRLWELVLAPAICQRRLALRIVALDRALGRPAGRIAGALGRLAFGFMEEVHPVRIDAPEEDYFLLAPAFACFLLVVPFPRSEAVWELVDIDGWPERERRALGRLYRRMVQRHLYEAHRRRGGEGVRLLSKNPMFTPFVRTLLEEFEDARVLGCARDPRRVVPSLLSSLEEGAELFGWSPARPPERDRLVDMLADFGGRLIEYERELPGTRYRTLLLGDVRADLLASVGEVYDRFGWSMDSGFRAALERRAAATRTHTSRHSYTLADYGLDASTVESRFSHVMTHFGFATEPARPSPSDPSTS
jgi:hypothetical protein